MIAGQIIKLRPTDKQVDLFHQHASAARIARNDVIALWKSEGRRLPGFRYSVKELRPVVNRSKFQDHPWIRELSQNAVKGGMIDAQDAIVRYYSGQNRRPTFHGKSARKSFRADNGVGTVRWENGMLRLPKEMGLVKVCKRSLRWTDRPIKTCRIREKAGNWYAVITVEIDSYRQCGTGTAGVDLGVKDLATIAYPDGSIEQVHGPEHLKRSMKRLRLASRRHSRKRIGSKNGAKAKRRLARVHAQVENRRKDFLRKLTNRITNQVETVAMEDLNLRGRQRMWGRRVSDIAPGELRRQLDYKSNWKGGQVRFADRMFPSSRLCHDCGWKNESLTLADRMWTCGGCGVIHARDANAARNLKDYDSRTLSGDSLWTSRKTSPEAVKVEAGTQCSDFSALSEI